MRLACALVLLALAVPSPLAEATSPLPETWARFDVDGSARAGTEMDVKVRVRADQDLVLIADSLDGPSGVTFRANDQGPKTLHYAIPANGFWRLRLVATANVSGELAEELPRMQLLGYSDGRRGAWASGWSQLEDELPPARFISTLSVRPDGQGGHLLDYKAWPLERWMNHGYLHATFGPHRHAGLSNMESGPVVEKLVYSGGGPLEWTVPVEPDPEKGFVGGLELYLHIEFTGARDETGHMRITLDCIDGAPGPLRSANGTAYVYALCPYQEGSPQVDPYWTPWTAWPDVPVEPSGGTPRPAGAEADAIPLLPASWALLALGALAAIRRR